MSNRIELASDLGTAIPMPPIDRPYAVRRARRVGSLMVVIVFALLTSLSVFATPAHASAYEQQVGYLGKVSVYGPMVTASDTQNYVKIFTTNGFVASRATAFTGAQRISATYQLQQLGTTGWTTLVTSQSFSGTVSGGGTLSFPALKLFPSAVSNFPQTFRIKINVMWSLASSGMNIGFASIVPSQAGDTACRANYFRGCTAYTNGVTI